MKAKVKRLGKVTVQKSEEGSVTLNVPATMQEDGIQRFVSSKRFKKIKGDRKELFKEGEMQVFEELLFQDVSQGSKCWIKIGKRYVSCLKRQPENALVVATNQTINPQPYETVLVLKTEIFSFIIKQNPA